MGGPLENMALLNKHWWVVAKLGYGWTDLKLVREYSNFNDVVSGSTPLSYTV